jgi:uncharacterized membrane protein
MGTRTGFLRQRRRSSDHGFLASGWGRGLTIAAAGVGGYVLYKRLAGGSAEPIEVRKSITIERPVGEVYRFWRDLENLPRVMDHLESVHELSDGRSRWTAKGPAKAPVTWEAQTTLDRENEIIAWRSVDDALVPNHGSVRFRSLGEDRTEIRVALSYQPPGGKVGAAFAKLFGEEPSQQVADGLGRLKQELETGDAMGDGYAQPSGRTNKA